MKKSFYIALLSVLPFAGYSQTGAIEAYFDYKSFRGIDGKSYLEIYIQVNAGSVKFKPSQPGLLRSSVEITEIVKKNDAIVDFRKTTLMSPEMADSAIDDFKDQQRFQLDTGAYELEVSIKDLYAENPKQLTAKIPVTINPSSGNIEFSDVQLIEGYSKATTVTPLTKSGYDLVPYVSNYYPPGADKIAFYAEIYNSLSLGNDEKFVLYQYIENAETKTQLSKFGKFSKQVSKEIVPVLSYLDIEALGTGNYNLVLELKNKNNEQLAIKKIFFQRYKPIATTNMNDLSSVDVKATFVDDITNEDTLNNYIASLRPLAGDVEKSMIDRLVKPKEENMLLKKQFFYAFWQSRNPDDPESPWNIYRSRVYSVERMFSTPIKRGYETDRGIVYLKYGAPDDVMDRQNEPSAYPYQVWHYHKISNFNNKRFVFYNPDLVTNDYVTLHSDVPGELKNYRWEQILHSRNSPNTDIDSGTGGNRNHWGGNSREFYKNPR